MHSSSLSAFLLLAPLALTGCGGGDVQGAGRAMIQNKGSDTLVNVAQAWAEEYRKVNPDIAVAVSGGGSGTGISSMINGTVDLANSSRPMTEREIEMARKNGIEPVEHVVGFDALAIYVHADNPIESITIEQLAGIDGENGRIERWSQLGIEMADKSADGIVCVSRQNNSGTHAYFRDAVLDNGGKYRLGTLDMPGSKDVVDLVGNTPGSIGYSGLAYANEHVKLVPVSIGGKAPVLPSVATAVSKAYPIARPLLMYTAGEPEGAVKTYLDWLLLPDGQKITSDKGYAPVTGS